MPGPRRLTKSKRLPVPTMIDRGLVLAERPVSRSEGTVRKLTSLKAGTRFKFAGVGGDNPANTIIGQSAKGVTILQDGGKKLITMPLPFFKNSKVILVK